MNQNTLPRSWYKQFWPWFLILLPGSAVIGGVVTLYIAFSNPPSLVKQEYYKDGLAINQYLHQDQLAVAMGITVKLDFDLVTNRISAQFNQLGDAPVAVMMLSFIHPFNPALDFQLPLQKTAPNHYQQQALTLEKTRWYIHLSPVQSTTDSRWRLRGEIDLSRSNHLVLGSTGSD